MLGQAVIPFVAGLKNAARAGSGDGIFDAEVALKPVEAFAAGSSIWSSSRRQAGWVKSPVPTTAMPLRLAQRSSVSGQHSLLVAMEYFEWM